jgi:hypothetical protein
MMVACSAPIKGTHLRLVKVDDCGIPVTGSQSLVIVTKGFVKVEMAPQYEKGVEFFERNADGEVCVNQKDRPTLKRMELNVDFCSVDPVAARLVYDARQITASGGPTGSGFAVTGTGFAIGEGEPLTRFSMEVWQRVAGSGACDPSGLPQYIYNAWPNVGNAEVGKYTVENGRSTLNFMSETAAASTFWSRGPGTGPSWLPTGFAVANDEHWLWNVTTTALPTAQCGPLQLT